MSEQNYLPSSEQTNPRTEAALARLRKAMADIEADIAAHQGIYPYNHGRVTQSELCRRADVKKATLQTPLHKDTTRVQVLAWLDHVTANLGETRDATRDKVTEVADQLRAKVQRLEAELQAAMLQLGLAEQHIVVLEKENAQLRSAGSALKPA